MPIDRDRVDETGKSLGKLFKEIYDALDRNGIDNETLIEFISYTRLQESVGPIFNPTAFARGNGFELIDAVTKRCTVIESLIRLREQEKSNPVMEGV